MQVSKATVIKALQTEPLSPGAYIFKDLRGNGYTWTCPVCAVGGVLRQAGVEPSHVEDVACINVKQSGYTPSLCIDMRSDIEDSIFVPFHTLSQRKQNQVIKQYGKMVKRDALGALSSFFEYLGDTYMHSFQSIKGNHYLRWNPNRLSYTRITLISFVKKHFPEYIHIKE